MEEKALADRVRRDDRGDLERLTADLEARMAADGAAMLARVRRLVEPSECDPTSYTGGCPICGAARGFVLHVDLARYRCWECGVKGGFIEFMEETNGAKEDVG